MKRPRMSKVFRNGIAPRGCLVHHDHNDSHHQECVVVAGSHNVPDHPRSPQYRLVQQQDTKGVLIARQHLPSSIMIKELGLIPSQRISTA